MTKLKLFGVTSLLLLALVGTGIFFGPTLSATYGGRGAVLVWLFLGLQNIYIGLIFGELISLHPKAGGIYEFAKQAYGQFASFMIGWLTWIVATITTSILIVGAFLYAFPQLSFLVTFGCSLAVLLILSAIAYRGLGTAESLFDIFAGVVIIFIITTIVAGFGQIRVENYTPIILTPTQFLVTLFFIMESYFGWEVVAFLAEETHEPKKTIPRALIISTILSSVVGFLLMMTIFGVIPAEQLATTAAPLAQIFSMFFGEWGSLILRAGVFLSLIGSAAGQIISTPRLISAMARDKLFIEQMSIIGSTGTPTRAIVLQTLLSALVLFFALGSYQLLISLLVPLAILMYVTVFIALPVLRIRQPGVREFNCPFPKIGPIILSVLFFLVLGGWVLFHDGGIQILFFAASLIIFCLPVYLFLQVYYNPSVQIWFANLFAYPSLILEDVLLPGRIREQLFAFSPNLRGKHVLEFGAGVGSFTRHLANVVTISGKVYAIEPSKRSFDILLRRVSKHKHVQGIHDTHAVSRIHPQLQHVDAVFSVGMLGYMQQRKRMLQSIAALLPNLGTVCFVEWVDVFGIFPNPPALDRSTLTEEFHEAGFSVKIDRVKGWFWNYLIVYGMKTNEPVPMI